MMTTALFEFISDLEKSLNEEDNEKFNYNLTVSVAKMLVDEIKAMDKRSFRLEQENERLRTCVRTVEVIFGGDIL